MWVPGSAVLVLPVLAMEAATCGRKEGYGKMDV